MYFFDRVEMILQKLGRTSSILSSGLIRGPQCHRPLHQKLIVCSYGTVNDKNQNNVHQTQSIRSIPSLAQHSKLYFDRIIHEGFGYSENISNEYHFLRQLFKYMTIAGLLVCLYEWKS